MQELSSSRPTKDPAARRPWIVSFGFLLFIFGILSMVLRLVGMQFQFMQPIETSLGGWSFIVYLVIALAGFMMVVITFDHTPRNK